MRTTKYSDTKKMVKVMVDILLEMEDLTLRIKQTTAKVTRLRNVHNTVSAQCNELLEILEPASGTIRACKELLLRVSNCRTDMTNEIMELSTEFEVYRSHLSKIDTALIIDVNWVDMP